MRCDAARLGLALVMSFVSAWTARAQTCVPGWQGVGTLSQFVEGVSGPVRSVGPWDPDGTGPQTPVMVVGGSFASAGLSAANNIAAYEPVSGVWSSLGAGISGGEVLALATLPTGELVAAGTFTSAGGVPVNAIAAWNGSTWRALGDGLRVRSGSTGTIATVRALLVTPGGDLYAGGSFGRAGSVSVANIARWNGLAWSALQPATGAGTNGEVFALAWHENALTVGGTFSLAGTLTVGSIARWNGSAWSSPYETGMVGGSVRALAVLSNGMLYAGGQFSTAGSATNLGCIARWNGFFWEDTFTSWFIAPFQVVTGLAVLPGDRIVAVGDFGPFFGPGGGPKNAAVFNGFFWDSMGTGLNGPGSTVAAGPDGRAYAGGSFSLAGGTTAGSIAAWTGQGWTGIAPSVLYENDVSALTTTASSEVIAGGSFYSLGAVPSARISRYNGTSWGALGAGGADGRVHALLRMSNGDIIAGGSFTSIGGVAARSIARWNGTAWSALGAGVEGTVLALAQLNDGNLVVGGTFGRAGNTSANSVARWNGATWVRMGDGILNTAGAASVRALLAMPDGSVIAGGAFTGAGTATAANIARWDGLAWSALGAGCNGPVYALTRQLNGLLIAGGVFTRAGGSSVNNIASWNGATWRRMTSGIEGMSQGFISGPSVLALATLPNGDVIAGGSFSMAGGLPAGSLARWNGTLWSPLGFGMNAAVLALAVAPNGDLVAGGPFTSGGGVATNFLVRYPACDVPLPTGFRTGRITMAGFPDPVVQRPGPTGERGVSGGGQTGGGLSDSTMSLVTQTNGSMRLGFTGNAPFHSVFEGYSASGTRTAPIVLELMTDCDFSVVNNSSANSASGPVPYTPVKMQALTGTITGDPAVGGLMSRGFYAFSTGVVSGHTRNFIGTGFEQFYGFDLSNPPGKIDSSYADWQMVLVPDSCPGDFSGDGFVDDTDFVTFAAAYEGFTIPPADARADLTGDGFVDDSDFVIFAAAYDGFVCP